MNEVGVTEIRTRDWCGPSEGGVPKTHTTKKTDLA